jgi:hypothetical protein
LQPNGFRRPLDVAVERGAVWIVGDGQIHAHGGKEVVEQFRSDSIAACGVADRRKHRIIAMLAAGKEPVG